jgi:release factor glutamine methyltransferase
MTIAEALKFIKSQLSRVAGESALFEAELILQHVLHYSRSQLYLRRKDIIAKELSDIVNGILERRIRHEPLPYILGTAYFHSREFLVNKEVLIPRPDTEILVETILESEKEHISKFLEIGVGSGAISAILLQEHPDWQCIGTDISFSALRIAKKNCLNKIHLLCSDLFTAIKPVRLFDFIVSNPPYIGKYEIAELDAGVKDFEPMTALLGGKDGLDFYRAFALQAMHFLKPEGKLYCEIGYLQKDSVINIFSSQGWKDVKVVDDLAGRPRVVVSEPSK